MTISLTFILAIICIKNVAGYKLPLIVYAGPFPVWCVFFAMGCYLRKCERKHSLFLSIIAVAIGLALEYVETLYLNRYYSGNMGIKCSSFVYSMAVITLLFSSRLEQVYKQNNITRVVEYIGSISFAVYLFHSYIIQIFSKLHITTVMPWILRWAICLFTTILVIELLKTILPKKCYWFFGV